MQEIALPSRVDAATMLSLILRAREERGAQALQARVACAVQISSELDDLFRLRAKGPLSPRDDLRLAWIESRCSACAWCTYTLDRIAQLHDRLPPSQVGNVVELRRAV